MTPLLPLCWPGYCVCTCEVLACARSLHDCSVLFLRKVPLSASEAPKKCLVFHIGQLSDQPSLSGSGAVTGPFLSTALGVTWLPIFSGTVPARFRCPSLCMLQAVCHLCLFITPSDFLHPGLCWCRSETSPLWEGRELLRGYH